MTINDMIVSFCVASNLLVISLIIPVYYKLGNIERHLKELNGQVKK